jgi:probable selenium-dependent hydroxylase accessory protein YqeC
MSVLAGANGDAGRAADRPPGSLVDLSSLMPAELLEALGATGGIVCLVGAGGKKTTMYALARAHPGRVLLSSTSHMYPYEREKIDCVVTLAAADAPLPDLADHRVVAVASATETPKRVGGLSADRIRDIYEDGGFDVCLIKADGARARWIKSPGEHEPVIPPFADTVIPVVSARVIGRPLDDGIAHRPERLARLLGIGLGETITAAHIADLLSHPGGALKGVGEADVIPLINMVDDAAIHAVACEAAIAALAQTDRVSRIVLAAMTHARLVEVIERES